MKIVILTAEPKNFVPVELKKEADSLGHEAEVVDIRKTFIVEATGGSKVMHAVEDELVELKPPFACIPRLNEHHLLYKLNVLTRLTDDGAYMLNTPASMELCNDKLGSQVKLNTQGITTPYSVVVGSPDMLERTVDHVEKDGKLKFPMILKTLRGTHGIGVMKVDSKASLISVAQALLANSSSEVMLQEFIEHDHSLRMIMVGDELLAANKRGQPKDKDEFRTNSHLGSKTERYEPSEEELALGRRIVELFGCRFCAIDYIQHDGKLIVLEVNGSPGLEAIQKDWEGERNLPKTVIEQLVKLADPGHIAQPTAAVASPEPIEGSIDVHPDAVEVSQPEPTEVETSSQLQPLGDVETLMIVRLAPNGLPARVDTGAAFCSLHADNVSEENGWVKFKRDGITYRVPVERHVGIRNAHGKSRRAIIRLDVELRGMRYNQVEFSVTSRSDLKYDALIGRNLLQTAGIPVLVPKDDKHRPSDLPPSEIEELDEE